MLASPPSVPCPTQSRRTQAIATLENFVRAGHRQFKVLHVSTEMDPGVLDVYVDVAEKHYPQFVMRTRAKTASRDRLTLSTVDNHTLTIELKTQ